MKKIIGNLLLTVCILCAVIGFSACEIGTVTPTPSQKESSIAIDDLTLTEGEEKEIKVKFVNLDEQEVTYAFQGNNIVIENGKVKGVTGGTVTEVTATTADGLYETTFKVNVEGLGTLTFEDLELKVGEQRKLRPKYSKPGVNEAITYTFEGDAVSITDGILKGLKEGTLTVTATSENYTATFSVTVYDYGTLTIEDVFMYTNSTRTIAAVFSKDGYTEEIKYVPAVKGVITIENGVITATGAGTTQVTATSENFKVKFNVTVGDIIESDKAIVFTDYMITLYPNAYGSEPVTLTTEDTDLVSIDGHNVKGLKKGTATVTVSDGTVSKDVKVEVRSHDMATDEGNVRTLATENDRLNSVISGLADFSYKDGELVLFAGDSFMDERWFLTDFYTTRFATKNAYTVGISSSRASAWIYMMQNFYEYQPKAIVLHIGTNDLFDGNRSTDSVYQSLETLFAMSHDNMPETEIYWWTIEQRKNLSAWNTKIQTINAAVQKYAQGKNWLKVIDTYTALSNADGTPNDSLYMDTIHPACPAGYDKLINLTYEAGLTITDGYRVNGYDKVKTWTTKQTDKVAAAKSLALTSGDYLVHTEITILSYGSNAHISIPFGSDNNRLLVWNSQSNGKFYFGGAVGGKYQGTSVDYLDAANGKNTASLDILVYDNNAYLFVNGKLERLFAKLPEYGGLSIGTEACAVKFENTAIYKDFDLGAVEFNKVKNDPQIATLLDSSTSKGILLAHATALPTLDNQALIDCQSYASIGEESIPAYIGARDRYFLFDGSISVKGNFAFSFDFERTTAVNNGYLGLSFSKVGSYSVWGQYHLFYQRNTDNGTFKVHSAYGSKAENPNYTGISADVTKMTCYVVRNGNTVISAYYINERYAASFVTYEDEAIALWMNIENMTGTLSNVSMVTDADKVTELYNNLTCTVKGHDWDKGTVTKEPTLTEKGNKHFVCNRCGETKDEEFECDHVWNEVWAWNGEKATLTLTCTVNENHTATLQGDDVTYTVSQDEGKWGLTAKTTYLNATYTNFKAYEDIYQNLVLGADEKISNSRYFKTTDGAWLFSAKIEVSGVKVANNVHLQLGKDTNNNRILVWSNSNQEDLTVHKFGYGKVADSNLALTDGAATLNVTLMVSSSKWALFVNGKLVLTYNSEDNREMLLTWKELIVGAEGGATWKFSNVVFESADGANYQKVVSELYETKTAMKAGTKQKLSEINAEYANAQYAEVTVYEPYGNMTTTGWSNFTIGIQLGIADKDGNEVYGFGSWHYSSLGYLLAWQQTAKSGTNTNDSMWNWMHQKDSGLNILNYFTDWSNGVKISVAIVEGDLYAFWSVDGGETWTKFVNNKDAKGNINEKVAEPASISYIFCGVDGFYSDLNASVTVPENILALVNG